MRNKLVLASLLLYAIIPVAAKADVSIGINLALYPNLVRVPGYPVYYAPQVDSNYFFYDGRYWVYADDSWYASSWYNGPWEMINSEIVPLYVLRIPVRYYRQPPIYFRGWSGYSPPHWGEHWGTDWSQHHRDWNHWDRHTIPAAAPLPVYQKQYSGNHYPQADQQQQLQKAHYQYQPHRTPVPQVDQAQRIPGAPAVAQPVTQSPKQNSTTGTHDIQRNNRISVAHQPTSETPHASSSAHQPRQVPAQTTLPRDNPVKQPPMTEHTQARAPRTRETTPHNHDEQQHNQKEEHQEKDRN